MSLKIKIEFDSTDRNKEIRKAARAAELENPRPRPQTFRVKKGKGSYNRKGYRSNVIPLRHRDE